jgi:hypothetical protein
MMPDDSAEEWRAVPSLDGHYEVSNLGRVRRALAAPRYGTYAGRPRKLRPNRYGYFRFNAVIGGRHVTCVVHLLVAEVFLPPKPSPAHEINHIDGAKANNGADNLEWVTPLENWKHALRLGLRPYRPTTKVTERQVRAIRRLSREWSSREIAEVFGVTTGCIAHIRQGRTWRDVT